MRVSPIGIWAREPDIADRVAREDSRLTHPHEVCVDVCGAIAAAIVEGIRTGDRETMFRAGPTQKQEPCRTLSVAPVRVSCRQTIVQKK